MEMLNKEYQEIVKRLQNARLSLLSKQPFYALLLMHMRFSLDVMCETVYTDGERIAFNPDFIKSLDDGELQFILMHEVLHAALGHPFRRQSDYDLECYDKACDIVVNSNILYSFDMRERYIKVKNYGVAMHKTPSGKEGYECTVEEVYAELLKAEGKTNKGSKSIKNYDVGDEQGEQDFGGNKNSGNDENAREVEDREQEQHLEESQDLQESQDSPQQDFNGTQDENINAPGSLSNKSSLSVGSSGFSTDNKDCNCDGFGAEDGYVTEDDLNNLIASLLKGRAVHGKIDPNAELVDNTDCELEKGGIIDDHSFWNGDEQNSIKKNTWLYRMVNSAEIAEKHINNRIAGGEGVGSMPTAAERLIKEIKNASLDWRTILNDFVQEDICDYSFSPPDRRMDDSPFFLPDFNEKDEKIEDLLFMVDTSASMSDEQITQCYSEIYGAIQQFNGKVTGKLGFFDAVVVEPIEFQSEDEFKIIRPKGGGGTSFKIIFEYVQEHIEDMPLSCIIILTDGGAPIPDESMAMGIPVLWIINNDIITPKWGKIARITNQ